MLNSQNTHLIETSYDRLKSKRNHFSNAGKILLKQEFSDDSLNIHEHKRYYYTFDNSLLLLRHSEHYTNLSTLNHNVSFLSVSTGALA